MTDDERCNGNGGGHGGNDDDDRHTSYPPIDPNALLDQEALQTLVKETVTRQARHERLIATLDDNIRAIAAGTSAWQQEINIRLERIDGCLQLLANKIMVLQFIKVKWPYAAAVAIGTLVAWFVWFAAHIIAGH